SAVETERSLTFDVSLLEAMPLGQSLTLALEAEEITARQGPLNRFGNSQNLIANSRNPIDFAEQNFEFSLDDGETWLPAGNGNEITFGFGLTYAKVRMPIHNDRINEGITPETLELGVADVVLGNRSLNEFTDTGIGSIIDDDVQRPVNVIISDAIATEGEDRYAIFNVDLSASSGQRTILQLEAVEGTGNGGIRANFNNQFQALQQVMENDELDLNQNRQNQLRSLENQRALEALRNSLSQQELKILDKALEAEAVDFAHQQFEVSNDMGATWQPVENGIIEIPQGTIDLTQVRFLINDDNFAEGSETFELHVANVVEGDMDSITDIGTATIVDNDPFIAAVFEQTFQAEDATLSGPIVFTGRASEGSGYVDYQNPSGDYVEWVVDVPEAGFYEISWRYQNGSGNRPLALDINGNTVDPSLDFPFSGGWTSNSWDFVSQVVELNAGSNPIRLSAIGQSGANFDFMQVIATGIDVVISDATATEGSDDYLIFDVGLTAPSNETITLDLSAIDGTARGGLEADFGIDPAGDPIDYANLEFEVSSDGGVTWQAAANGTEVTFAPGDTDLQVRLAINDDDAPEGAIPETMQLAVNSVLAGVIRDATDRGDGLITDNEVAGTGTPPISLLPASDIRVEGDVLFTFDGTDGGLLDGDNDEIGFTMVDPTSNPGNPNPIGGVVGYWNDKLDVTNGLLEITATNGIQFRNVNSQDNALGIGLNLPSQNLKLETTLVDLPTAPGGFAQAGLWFGQAIGGGDGSSEDNYIKFVAISPGAGNYQLQALIEQAGIETEVVTVEIPNDPASLDLELFLDPEAREVSAFYSVSGGAVQPLTTFENVPDEWFSFDQAGIDPTIATRSFGGVFATSRNASSEQVFSFDDFSVTEEEPPDVPFDPDFLFDRWTLPVNRPTAIDVGPDGRIYVATLFGNIVAFDIDPTTRTFEQEVITTIRDEEGGNRLTLGIAVDPDSTAENVVLWVGHSNGSVNNGALNSGKLSRLSGPGFTQKEDVVTGLPRAIANHATNNIDFGPDGRLYIWQGGNTGAGSANDEPTEFLDRPEQTLSAAVLAVDIPSWKADPTNFNGDVASPIGEFVDEFYDRKAQELGREFTEVTVYASGLRNTYDGVFHSNGNLYAPDNGLGVTGTVPPVPRLGDPTDRSITTLFGEDPVDNPGVQPDPLNRIVEGGHYGHPDPYRDEVVFKTGAFQGFNNTDANPSNDIPVGHPEYTPPFLNLGSNRSANGIIEYTADNFFGALDGDLFINNFSSGDDVTRIQLTPDGLAPVNASSLAGGFIDPLPIAIGPNGSELEGMFFVGEFNGGRVTVMESLGVWRTDLPNLPNALGVLDAGSAVVDGKLYMVGGKTNNGPINDVYVYDPGDSIDAGDDVWTTLPNGLPGSAVENPAVVSFDGQLYVFGGSTGPFSGAVNNAAVLDPDTNTWTSLASMPTARGGANAEVLDGKIYVVGGLASDGSSLDTVETFDPVTGMWDTGTALQTRRDNPGAAVVDDLLYVFGGRTRNADGTTIDGGLSTLEIYDPVADQWVFGTDMPNGRRTMSVGTINGRIQVIGGEGAASLDFNQEYNPATGAWRTLPDIPTPRHGSAFGTIDDVIYVAGGGPTPGSSFTDVTEAFTF
ncbi:MAG: kelch repeat-containing protein, partial [Cyanobacteria bacterium P01_G01_bin.49]